MVSPPTVTRQPPHIPVPSTMMGFRETKFACVDGPEFDGHKVDYAELMSRNGTYREREAEVARDHVCRMEAMGKALIK